ncbi:MAG TPA: galactokinase [bacterium]|nr:galactokinase [bacterium]
MEISERMRLIEKELDARFGARGPAVFFRSPGRVDVMGSHTDYNEGLILACTVDKDILAGARAREGGVLNLYSLNTGLEVRVHKDKLANDPEHGWANYAKGVIRELLDLKVGLSGLDLVVHGEIPVGGNLSSSAALEAVTCEAALGVTDTELPPWERVQLCLRAENLFVGLPCGIMDQFTVFMGSEKKALLLDCRSLDFETVPFAAGAVLMVIDSGLGRALVAGKYQERVRECTEAVKVLRKSRQDIKALRDASLADLEESREALGHTLYRRARHVVTENQRVRQAGEAMKSGDMPALGRIMEQGYESSRGDYENSIPELDALHDLAAALPGVYGVRICGAGWGGCLLALVERDRAPEFRAEVLRRYSEQTGRPAQAWAVEPSAGAGPMGPE